MCLYVVTHPTSTPPASTLNRRELRSGFLKKNQKSKDQLNFKMTLDSEIRLFSLFVQILILMLFIFENN